MISILVYGRNDNYGYNLHKRAAISLNCLAEVLREAEDELIFVDYNSPDDLPPFPEAIADTLTARTREVLRILRARPSIHARYAERSRLLALEGSGARYRSAAIESDERWVLSTNTDIAIDGFDQRMLRAWHVDFNLAKRLTLHCGPVWSLLDQVYCYHCDHMRQATPAHTLDNLGNSMLRFVDAITHPDLPEQRQSWGCASDAIQEIRLSQIRISG